MKKSKKVHTQHETWRQMRGSCIRGQMDVSTVLPHDRKTDTMDIGPVDTGRKGGVSIKHLLFRPVSAGFKRGPSGPL